MLAPPSQPLMLCARCKTSLATSTRMFTALGPLCAPCYFVTRTGPFAKLERSALASEPSLEREREPLPA